MNRTQIFGVFLGFLTVTAYFGLNLYHAGYINMHLDLIVYLMMFTIFGCVCFLIGSIPKKKDTPSKSLAVPKKEYNNIRAELEQQIFDADPTERRTLLKQLDEK